MHQNRQTGPAPREVTTESGSVSYKLPETHVMNKVFNRVLTATERAAGVGPAVSAQAARAAMLGIAAAVRDILADFDRQAPFDAVALELRLHHIPGVVTAPGAYWTAAGERRCIDDPGANYQLKEWTDGINGGNREGWEPLCTRISDRSDALTTVYRMDLAAAAEFPQPDSLPDPLFSAAEVAVQLPRGFMSAYEDEFAEIHQDSDSAADKQVWELLMRRPSRHRVATPRYLLGHLADTAQTLDFLTEHAEIHHSTRRARLRGCAVLLDTLAADYGIRPWPRMGHGVRPLDDIPHCEECASLVGYHPPVGAAAP
ncbi:hypothetical protein [Streptomyces sp. NEAU-174]|uniref:hypothetical protein n=1 Tax=Streptomyces sp. NEAU-174 TaxID=3458254 RepID=UPI0040448F20